MSIYISHFPEPIICGYDCNYCDTCHGKVAYCRAEGRLLNEVNWKYDKPTWCPITEIVEPHGRLIDAKHFEEMLDEQLAVIIDTYGQRSSEAKTFALVYKILKEEETIIKAEDADDLV